MGCAASFQRERSGSTSELENEAEKLLQQAYENEKYNLKVLLLGAGESGKTTVLKQIKWIWNVQDSSFEKVKYILALRRNVIEAIQTLLQASSTLDCQIEDEVLRPLGKSIVELDNNSKLTEELAQNIYNLWKSPTIQQVYSRRNEFWNMDATPYYLNEALRIAASDFEPNEEDLIMTRIRTTGIVVSEIQDPPYRFQIVDVGGQRSERRKWIHCFDDVKSIIYLASLSGYNQVLFEDQTENIMHESLRLFEDVVKNPLFRDTPLFVFLNKKDLFEDLIKKSPLKNCFPDYEGPENEMMPALEFIKMKFNQVVEKHTPGKPLVIHVIAARVRRDMKMAFGEVKDQLKKEKGGGKGSKSNQIQPAKKVK